MPTTTIAGDCNVYVDGRRETRQRGHVLVVVKPDKIVILLVYHLQKGTILSSEKTICIRQCICYIIFDISNMTLAYLSLPRRVVPKANTSL